jgi:hypothetical protein
MLLPTLAARAETPTSEVLHLAQAPSPPAPTPPAPPPPAASPRRRTAGYGLRDPLERLSLEQGIGLLIRFAVGLSGALFLLYFIYGGFLWMMAGGESDKVTKARQALKNASIGMAVIILSYTLISLIIQYSNVLQGAS